MSPFTTLRMVEAMDKDEMEVAMAESHSRKAEGRQMERKDGYKQHFQKTKGAYLTEGGQFLRV